VSEWLRELYGHQAWADAEHWRAFEAHPASLADPTLLERLHHLHLVQRLFLSLGRGEAPRITKLADFASPRALRDDARSYHSEATVFLEGVDSDRLEDPVTIPWFGEPALRLSLGRAMTQAAMHSHYHRAQNATRLRELGVTPPNTDLIVWYWKGQPTPAWD
jgi:uncharacterized damage-inducible protein DinB